MWATSVEEVTNLLPFASQKECGPLCVPKGPWCGHVWRACKCGGTTTILQLGTRQTAVCARLHKATEELEKWCLFLLKPPSGGLYNHVWGAFLQVPAGWRRTKKYAEACLVQFLKTLVSLAPTCLRNHKRNASNRTLMAGVVPL